MDAPWFKKRTYLHFDNPINLEQATKLVLSPKNIISHSFYPFLSCELKVPKLKKSKQGILHRQFKSRKISYAAHKDSHIFSYYAYLLNEKYEALIKNHPNLDDSILAFRKLGKSNIDFAQQAFAKIANYEKCTVIALDISGFFDNINHQILKKMWCLILGEVKLPDDHYAVFKEITKFSIIDKDFIFREFGISVHNPRKGQRTRICSPKEFRDFRNKYKLPLLNKSNQAINLNRDKGIPQGSPISSLLSNIYMIEFDKFILDIIGQKGTYLRYCDDILCIVPNEQVDEIQLVIKNKISELELEINQSKTEIIEFKSSRGKIRNTKPLQYLGFIFKDGSVSIRSAAFTKYSRKIKRGVSLAKQTQRKHNKLRVSRGLNHRPLFKKKLYSCYSHFGRQNFISYGKKAARTFNSTKIRKQLKPLWKRLNSKIDAD